MPKASGSVLGGSAFGTVSQPAHANATMVFMSPTSLRAMVGAKTARRQPRRIRVSSAHRRRRRCRRGRVLARPRQHHHAGADLHTIEEVLDVLVDQPDAAG